MKLLRLALLILAFNSLAPAAQGQAKLKAEDVLHKTLENYKRMSKNLRSLHVVSVERRWDRITKRSIVAGVKPNKLRLESVDSDAPPDYAVVSDGEALWFYNRRRHAYMKHPATEANPVLLKELYGDRVVGVIQFFERRMLPHVFAYLDKAVVEMATNATSMREETDRREGKPVRCYVIDSRVTHQGRVLTVTLWIEKNRLLLHRLEATVQDPSLVSPIIIYLSVNEPLPHSLFTFIPPKGARHVKTAREFTARP